MHHNQLFIYTLQQPILIKKDRTHCYPIETLQEQRRIDYEKSLKREKTGACLLIEIDAKIRKLVSESIKTRFIYQICYFYTL